MQIILCVSIIVCGIVYCLVRGWWIVHSWNATRSRHDGKWHDRTNTLRIVDGAGITTYYTGIRHGVIDWSDVREVEEI